MTAPTSDPGSDPGPDPDVGGAAGKEAADLLSEVVARLPGGGEPREGQERMARAVASAAAEGRHLVVTAGTGTGKTLGYLVPALASGQRVVVATATKALQDQLDRKDLPSLDAGPAGPVSWAVLKGRSNYLCLQRLDELGAPAGSAQASLELGLDPDAGEDRPSPEILTKLQEWAERTDTGDRADLDFEPGDRAWSAVTVGPQECPGKARCPRGNDCFSESARERAQDAQVIVVNLHLYALHLATGGRLIPEHDLLVVDEAHQLEEVLSAVAGAELGAGRVRFAARRIKGVLADPELVDAFDTAALRLNEHLAPLAGERVPDLPDELVNLLSALGTTCADTSSKLREFTKGNTNVDLVTRAHRVIRLLDALEEAAATCIAPPTGSVRWVEEGMGGTPILRTAPLWVADWLRYRLWEADRSGPGNDEVGFGGGTGEGAEGPALPEVVVLTSATIPPGMARRLGLPEDRVDELDVGSPFHYEDQAMLYCATSLPSPKEAAYPAAMAKELAALITAAGGRTLALFTSYRAMHAAADAVDSMVGFPIYRQGELPKGRLIERFTKDEEACLFATLGFWQGIDVPGRSLSLVTIDRLPFPRPDEPLLAARRDAAGASAFAVVDVPRAATLLAQAAGRLIRTAEDRGVVAVLDKRLATAKSYRWTLIAALPPMRRTAKRDEVETFLRSLR